MSEVVSIVIETEWRYLHPTSVSVIVGSLTFANSESSHESLFFNSWNNYFHKTLLGLGYEYWGDVNGIKHCEKRLPLKWHSFRGRSNFPRIWFRELRLRIWGIEINHLKAHNFVWQGFFYFIIISQLRRPIELKFSQVCYFMYMLSYTKWEDWSLTINNSVRCL